ncbi:hypothetical protein MBLNU459_g0553t1 [Dothideomycetes sp. NU459]
MSTPFKEAEIVDAWERLRSSSPAQGDVENMIAAGREQRLWRFMHDLCPELRPEDFADASHANAAIEQIRRGLWTPDRLEAHRLGCRVPVQHTRSLAGWAQTAWEHNARMFGEPLPVGLEDVNIGVYNACGNFDFLNDPRTGLVASKGHFETSPSPTLTRPASMPLERRMKLGLALRMVEQRCDLLERSLDTRGLDDITRQTTEELYNAFSAFLREAKDLFSPAEVANEGEPPARQSWLKRRNPRDTDWEAEGSSVSPNAKRIKGGF